MPTLLNPSSARVLGWTAFVLAACLAWPADAATLYWIGAIGGNVSTASNWATADPVGCTGTPSLSAPTTSDTVVFDPDCDNNATINVNLDVAGINIPAGYSGTLTQNAGVTVTVGASHYVQADGTFTGSDAAIDINGNLTLSGGTLTATSGAFTVSGNWAKSGGTFTSGANTVTFDGSSTQTINSGGTDTGSDFNNLTKSNSGTLQLTTNALDIDGTLTISSGTTLDVNGRNLTAATLDNPGTLLLEGGETVTITTFDAAEGTVTYDGTGTYTSGLAAGDTYYNLTFDSTGASWTLDAAADVNGSLTITNGTLDVHSSNNYGVTVGGNWSNSGTFTERSGTVTFDGAAAQTLTGETFYNLTINNSAASPGDSTDVDSSAAVTVTNTLTIADGQFQPTTASDFAGVTIETNGILKPDASATMTVSGNWTTTGTFTSNSGTITFDASSGTQTINAGGTANANKDFDNLTKSGGGTLQLTSTALEIDDTLTVSSSTTVDLNGQNASFVTLDNSGTLLLEGGETVTNTTFDTNSGTVTYDGTGTYSGGLVAGDTYYNLTLNGSGGSWTLDAALDVNNNVTITAGTLDTSSGNNYAITLAGNWDNSGTFTERSGTVTFDGAAAQTLTGETFYNLTVNNTAASPSDTVDVDPSAAVTVSNTLTITDGQFQPTTASDFAAVTIGTNGILKPDSSANLTVSGAWTNSGTYTANTGTITLDGSSQTLAGTTTFYNLTKSVASAATLTVPASITTTISGTLTLNGASGQLLSLRSSSSSGAATLANAGTTTVSYLDIKDSTLTVSATCSTGCVDSGNNTLWSFTASSAGTSTTTAASEPATTGPRIDDAPLQLDQGSSGSNSSSLVASLPNQLLQLTARPGNPELLRHLRLRLLGKLFFFTPADTQQSVYHTSLRLPGVVGVHAYALTADYGTTTRTTYGTIEIRHAAAARLVPQIDQLFRQIHGHKPTASEKTYWASRVKRGDKTTVAALRGAIEWHQLHRRKH